MAKARKPRKRYRGRDSAVTPPVIRLEAKSRNRLQNWWLDHKQTVIIRLVQLALLLILAGLLAWIF